MMSETIRIFVGTDRSQLLAVKVLEHSIKRHTQLDIQVIPMLDLPVKQPNDPKNYKRTGFSFSRFCIPKLANYNGKAIYMDADMLVRKDISSLWNIPIDNAKIIIQEDIPPEHQESQKLGAPGKRIKQCAVMILNCSRLEWEIDSIIDDLNQDKYDYEMLMYDLCILDEENDIKFSVPFQWNSLEYYDQDTCLIHYTDMATQPWVFSGNPYGNIWLDELRLMINNGTLTWKEIEQEIELGYFRPSLIRELKFGQYIPKRLQPIFSQINNFLDKLSHFKPHKEVYQLKKIRETAINRQKQLIA